jgi:hypothetical protein
MERIRCEGQNFSEVVAPEEEEEEEEEEAEEEEEEDDDDLVCKSPHIVNEELWRFLAFRQYCEFFAVFKNFYIYILYMYIFIPQFLVEFMTMFCGTQFAKH